MSLASNNALGIFDVVALLRDHPERALSRGDWGRVVERWDAERVEVEFFPSSARGRIYATLPVSWVGRVFLRDESPPDLG